MIIQWTQGANAQTQIGPYTVWTWATGDAGEPAGASGGDRRGRVYFQGMAIGRMGAR